MQVLIVLQYIGAKLFQWSPHVCGFFKSHIIAVKVSFVVSMATYLYETVRFFLTRASEDLDPY